MGGEEQTAASETDSENSNSQPFEMVEKEDVVEEGEEDDEEKDIEKAPDKGSCVEEIKESSEGELEDEEDKEHKKSTSS